MPDRYKSDVRPLSPRLSIYRWRAPMLASLLHRTSGLMLVLFVPLYLWLLHGMTGSPEDFRAVRDWMHTPFGKLLLWLAGVALSYHFANGLRFLSLDAGWCESRAMMRLSARVVLAFAALAAIVLAVLL
ncbi:MAG: succinate dehydrogenase, cytochrome b556 subunit [Mariprofundaceae bacterium]